MEESILIVEDEFIVANDLRMILEKAGHQICGIAPSYLRALDLIESKKPKWVLLDIFLKGDKTGIDLAQQLNERKIPFIYISANTNQSILEAAKATQPYGFLVKPFREKDLLVMLDIAAYNYQQSLKYNQQSFKYNQQGLKYNQHGLKYNHQGNNIFQQQMETLVTSTARRQEKIEQAAELLGTLISFDYLSIIKADYKSASGETVVLKKGSGYRLLKEDELLDSTGVSKRDAKVWRGSDVHYAEPMALNGYDFKRTRINSEWLKAISSCFQLNSALVFPLVMEPESYLFCFYSREPEQYNKQHIEQLNLQQAALISMINDVVLQADIEEKQVISAKKAPVIKPDQIEKSDFHGIVGKSPLLQSLFAQIDLVAPDDISILILGESGTGKERIAQVIHQLSPRKNKPLITVNCAALPVNLIESELFGHEKGSFTGAFEKRIGKFEQADGGSIFLDEIGELPLDAQVKLLRVLQEKEIERVGGSSTKKINVRIITATNRNLEKEVAEGRFRLDLYYRLNVFPIELPPLRARKEDITLLSYHFLDKYAKKFKRNVNAISDKVISDLKNYNWPGNIRELEHLIEKSVIVTTGEEITSVQLPQAHHQVQSANNPFSEDIHIKTLEEMERDHIMSILSMCKGKIFGPGGAAEILNIPSTTLNSKIKRLGIKYEFVK